MYTFIIKCYLFVDCIKFYILHMIWDSFLHEAKFCRVIIAVLCTARTTLSEVRREKNFTNNYFF